MPRRFVAKEATGSGGARVRVHLEINSIIILRLLVGLPFILLLTDGVCARPTPEPPSLKLVSTILDTEPEAIELATDELATEKGDELSRLKSRLALEGEPLWHVSAMYKDESAFSMTLFQGGSQTTPLGLLHDGFPGGEPMTYSQIRASYKSALSELAEADNNEAIDELGEMYAVVDFDDGTEAFIYPCGLKPGGPIVYCTMLSILSGEYDLMIGASDRSVYVKERPIDAIPFLERIARKLHVHYSETMEPTGDTRAGDFD